GRQLLKIGVNALPVLMRVARGRNQEMAQAAQTLAQELRERVPPAQLRFREEDLVQTPDFSIVGRVVAPTLKARSPYFGPVDLKVSQLVGLRRVGELREVTLTIDAEQYANGKRNWLDTRVAVEAGAPLTITATGEVDLWPLGGETGVYVGNPSGSAHGCGYGQGYGMEGREEHSGGTLLGRIGQGGSVFKVGERYCGTANQSGRLFLRIAPSPWGNASSGAYKVRITAADSGSDWPAGEQELSDL
ncbi:MAG TPA: hypothetical protein VEL76_34660, partial [Gemmataceae bacterium]|nr:hypothetical protein [Gemmataceae bacterium]